MSKIYFLSSAIIICLFCGCNKSEETTSDIAVTESNSPIKEIQKEREKLDKTVFENETKAVQHEQVFISLWDQLRNSKPLKVLNDFKFKTCLLYTSPSPRDS